MPFHFCADELLAILAMILFIGIMFRKLHAWWHSKFHHVCHEKHCDETHAEHEGDTTCSRETQAWVEATNREFPDFSKVCEHGRYPCETCHPEEHKAHQESLANENL
jgi:hypothetical protein